MNDTIVKVERVSKKFCTDLKLSLWFGIKDLIAELFLKKLNTHRQLRESEFWAVKKVSFDLKRGECLGLIGHNGAGKTTLLRMLNGLIKPDEGYIEMKGRVGALIALGAGFNPILTGRENIYVNAAVLGLNKREINKNLESIIDFAEIKEFIDTPVGYYSSGMYVRLGFSIAAHSDPELLLVDEILAVGDITFRSKCLNRISKLMSSGTAIVFVSHQMSLIDKISDRVMLLRSQKDAIIGSPSEMIDQYRKIQVENNPNSIKLDHKFLSIETVSIRGVNNEIVTAGESFFVEATYCCNKALNGFPSIAFHKGHGEQIAATRTDRDGFGIISFAPPGGILRLVIDPNPFSPGNYSISVRVYSSDNVVPLVDHHAFYPFFISGGASVEGTILLSCQWIHEK